MERLPAMIGTGSIQVTERRIVKSMSSARPWELFFKKTNLIVAESETGHQVKIYDDGKKLPAVAVGDTIIVTWALPTETEAHFLRISKKILDVVIA